MTEAVQALRTARRLLDIGKAAQSVGFFRRAIACGDHKIRLVAMLGLSRVQLALEDFSGAEIVLTDAIALAPADCTAYSILSLVLRDVGRLEEAASAAVAALQRACGPAQSVPLLNLAAGIALRRGLIAEAQGFLMRCLAMRPLDRRALSYLPAVNAALGLGDGQPFHVAELVRLGPACLPKGSCALSDFNAEIARSVAASRALSPCEPGKTLVGGARLPSFEALPAEIVRALRALFQDAVDRYVRSLKSDRAHSVIAVRPAQSDFVGWANLMIEGAYERPHIHENGWLSGVYYAEMPALDPQSNSADAAAILFGGHDLPEDLLPAGPILRLVPNAGDVVVFPSWLYHRTAPFRGGGRRISVAFDVQSVG